MYYKSLDPLGPGDMTNYKDCQFSKAAKIKVTKIK